MLVPLRDTYGRLNETLDAVTVTTAPIARSAGWISGNHLVEAWPQLTAVRGSLMRVGRDREPTPEVVALATLARYTWLVWLTIGGAYLIDRRVPALTPAGLRLPITMDAIRPAATAVTCRVDDALAGRDGVTTVDDEEALRRRVREVAAAHLDQVFTATRGLVHRSRAALWAMATDQATAALWRVGRAHQGDAWAAWQAQALLPGATPPFVGGARFEHRDEHPVRRRQTCCRYHTMGGEACAACPLRAQRLTSVAA